MKKTPKLRFPGFNSQWEERKISDVTSYVDYRGKTPQKVNKGIYLITAKNVKFGYIDYECSKEYIKDEEYETIMSRGLPKIGDVLITTEAPCGNVAQIDNTNVALAQRIIKYRGVENILDNSYLKYVLLSDTFQKKLSSFATGGTVSGIKGSVLHNIKINLPHLEEQQKVGKFLLLFDKKIKKQQEKLEALEEYKKGIMQKIFSQEIRFKDENGEEYPEWEEKRIDEIAHCLDNNRKPLNSSERSIMQGDIPYYGANGVVDFVNDYIFDEDIILLAEDGGNFDDFETKPIAQLVRGKSWVNNHAHVLRAKCNTNFLFFSLVHKDIREYINGTSRAKLNKSDMLNILVNIPKSLDEQTKISRILNNIFNKAKKEQEKLDYLNELKKALLQQMFV